MGNSNEFTRTITQDIDHNKNRLAGLKHLQDRLMDKIMHLAKGHFYVGPVPNNWTSTTSVPAHIKRILFHYRGDPYFIMYDKDTPISPRVEKIVAQLELNDATIDYLNGKATQK